MGLVLGCCAAEAACCCVGTACTCCGKAFSCTRSVSSKVGYATLFLVTGVVAWVLSNWASTLLGWIPWLNHCVDDGACAGALATLRITLGLFLFHVMMALLSVGISTRGDPRLPLQNGWWPLKLCVYLMLMVIAFCLPNAFFVDFFGWFAMIGAALFILVQLLMLVDFAHSWNENWVRRTDSNEHYFYALLGVMISAYVCVLGLSVTMYVLFAVPADQCAANVVFVTLNLAAGLLIAVVSLLPAVQQSGGTQVGLLQASVVSLYCTYLVFSSILSEPDSVCYPFSSSGWLENASIAVGALFTVISVGWSAFRASSADLLAGYDDDHLYTSAGDKAEAEDEAAEAAAEAEHAVEMGETALSAPVKPLAEHGLYDAEEEEDGDSGLVGFVQDVPEDQEVVKAARGSVIFHVAFALGALYVGMLLTNWVVLGGTSQVEVDSGWPAVWIKIVSGWVCILIYLWTIVAPVLFPDRVFT